MSEEVICVHTCELVRVPLVNILCVETLFRVIELKSITVEKVYFE